jgi:WD40 repeat protein
MTGKENPAYEWVSFSADNQNLLTSSYAGVHIWDLTKNRNDRVLTTDESYTLVTAARSPGCVAAGGKHQVRIWSGRGELSKEVPEEERYGLAADCDASRIFTVGPTGVELFEWDQADPISTHQGGERAAISADTHFAAFCSSASTLELLYLQPNQTPNKELGSCYPGSNISFSPDSRYLAFDSLRDIEIVELSTGTKRMFRPCDDYSTFGIGSKGALVAVLCKQAIRIYDVNTREEIAHSSAFHTPYVEQLIFSPDNQFLAINSDYASSIEVKRWKRAGLRQWILERLERLGLKAKDET